MTATSTIAPHASVTAQPSRAVGALSALPLLLAGLLCVPFLTPAVTTDEHFGWLLAGGVALLLAVAAGAAWLHDASHLQLDDGELRVRAWSLRPTVVRLDEVVDAYVTPVPCGRGHVRCCSHDGIPTLHLVDASGTSVAIRTGGWWADEEWILASLRTGLRGNERIDLERAWLLRPPAQITVP